MMCSIRCMSTFASAFDVMNHKTDGQQLAILPRNRNREYFLRRVSPALHPKLVA